MRRVKKLGLFLILFASFVVAQNDKNIDMVHFKLGEKFYNEGKYSKAIEEFRKMLTLYPDYSPAYRYIAKSWSKQDKHALSIYNLKKAKKYDPDNIEIIKELAESYNLNDEKEKAIKFLRDYADQVKDTSKKKSAESKIQEILSDVKNADSKSTKKESGKEKQKAAPKKEEKDSDKKSPDKIDAKEKSSKRESKDAFKIKGSKHNDPITDPLMKDIVNYYNNGEYGKALKECRILLRKKPGHPGAYYYAGIVRRHNNELKKAIINFKKSFDYPKRGYNAHFYLGLIYEDLQKYKEAIKEFEKYMNLTSYGQGKNIAKSKISRLLKKIKTDDDYSYGQDLADIKKQKKKSPFSFKISNRMTFIIEDTLSATGRKMLKALDKFLDERYDSALKDLKKIHRQNPSSNLTDNALYNTGLVYAKMRLWDYAEKFFKKVIYGYPKGDVYRAAYVMLGYVYAKRGDYKEAQSIFNKYLKRYPSDKYYSYINSILGDISYEKNEQDDALKYYLKALGKENDYFEKIRIKYKIGECYYKKGSSRGLDYFKDVANADSSINFPEVMKACYRLGDYYFGIKNMESALKYYRLAAKRFPNSKNITWALYQIGNIYKQGNVFDKAIEYYDKLINEYPDDYWAVQAKWKREDTVWENEYKEILK